MKIKSKESQNTGGKKCRLNLFLFCLQTHYLNRRIGSAMKGECFDFTRAFEDKEQKESQSENCVGIYLNAF